MYRLLATGPLPSARDAIEALRQPQTAKLTMKEMAALLRSCVDDQGGDPAEDACVTECVRRLREAGDGGEHHLDKRLASGVRIVPLAPEATGFNAWRREEEPNRSGGTAEWLLPEGAEDKAERVLFLHGGGYSWYSPSDVYRPFTTRLAAGSGLAVLAIDYRLAPEFAAPAALEDALAALRWLWAHGPGGEAPARRVLVVGDSAGGGLALSLMHALHVGECSAGGVSSAGVRPPSAVVALSPWTDLTSSLPSYSSRAFDKATRRGDPVFSDGGEVAAEVAASVASAAGYVGGSDAADARLSPVFSPPASLAALPPTLLVVGDAEVMLSDSTEFAARALEAGAADVRLRVYPRMWHVFPLYTEACGQRGATLAPAVRALSEVSSFIKEVAAG